MGVAATQCVLGMLGASSAVRSTCEVANDEVAHDASTEQACAGLGPFKLYHAGQLSYSSSST